jgi:hypothetical protein
MSFSQRSGSAFLSAAEIKAVVTTKVSESKNVLDVLDMIKIFAAGKELTRLIHLWAWKHIRSFTD